MALRWIELIWLIFVTRRRIVEKRRMAIRNSVRFSVIFCAEKVSLPASFPMRCSLYLRILFIILDLVCRKSMHFWRRYMREKRRLHFRFQWRWP